MSMSRTLLIAAALALSATALGAAPAGAQTVTQSYPVGVKFDGRLVASRVFVRFPATPIAAPFADFARRTPDPAAAAFVALVQAAKAGDVAAGRAVLDLTAHGPAPTATVLESIAGLAGGWDRAEVVARFAVDDSQVFVFRAPRAKAPPASGALAFRQQNGAWKGRIVTSREPAISLVVDAYDNHGAAPSEFAPLPQTRTEYAIPLSADDAVWLEFDGRQLDFAPLAPDAAPSSDATALYQQAALALARVDWPAFAALHTPESQAKIEGWLANQGRDPRARATAAALIARDTRVVFEMDLGPEGVMLLYGQGEQVAPAEQALKRVMIARTADGLRLTSYFMTYQFGLTLMRSPRWPKRVGELTALLERAKR